MTMDILDPREQYNPGSPEQLIEERVARLIDDLDELCALATNSQTVALVEGQRIAVGQIVTRSQLLASFLAVRQPIGKLRVVGNG